MAKNSPSSKGRGSRTTASASRSKIAAQSRRLDRMSERITKLQVNVRAILSWIATADGVETDTLSDAED